jgi:hypothetical protein
VTAAYSCLVDGGAKFEWQAVNLCSSLMRNAGVQAQDIKVHVTPSVSEAFRTFVDDHGMSLVPVDPFPGDHGYCNKIQQAFSPAFDGYEKAVLCDCDLYFVRPFKVGDLHAPAAGRVVDRPNPPLPLLRSLYDQSAVFASPVREVGLPMADLEETIASNWNGGLYVFDVEHLPAWGAVWSGHARRLLNNIAALGEYSNHIDQISLALTIDELSIPNEAIPLDHNYPIHLDAAEAYRQAPPDIASFHYHDRMDSLGHIKLTGVAELDSQIEALNWNIQASVTARLIRDDTLFHLFQRWQSYCSTLAPERVAASLTAFQNPRYIRHNARRLEHLASLDLDLFDKTVLEFGAGVGDHSLFFLDRGCHVTSIEPREENVECILHRHKTERPAFPEDRHRVIRCDAAGAASVVGQARFQIVYNYGLLYHLDQPERFLRQSAAYCEGLYLLETAVADLGGDSAYVEDASDLTNAVDGACLLLSRQEIFDILGQCLPYVYTPRTQPAHEQFPRDWTTAPQSSVTRHRAIFIGSMSPLPGALFANQLLDHYDR